MSSPVYYGVRNGRTDGVFYTWEECREQTENYAYADYRKFTDFNEALAYVTAKSRKQTDMSSPRRNAVRPTIRTMPGLFCGTKRSAIERVYQREEALPYYGDEGVALDMTPAQFAIDLQRRYEEEMQKDISYL